MNHVVLCAQIASVNFYPNGAEAADVLRDFLVLVGNRISNRFGLDVELDLLQWPIPGNLSPSKIRLQDWCYQAYSVLYTYNVGHTNKAMQWRDQIRSIAKKRSTLLNLGSSSAYCVKVISYLYRRVKGCDEQGHPKCTWLSHRPKCARSIDSWVKGRWDAMIVYFVWINKTCLNSRSLENCHILKRATLKRKNKKATQFL